MGKKIVLGVLCLFLLLVFTGCMPGDGKATSEHPAGFFAGIWHGWLAPVSLVVRLIKPEIRIYEIFNTGWWYDFGYYIAVISGLGGLSMRRARRR